MQWLELQIHEYMALCDNGISLWSGLVTYPLSRLECPRGANCCQKLLQIIVGAHHSLQKFLLMKLVFGVAW